MPLSHTTKVYGISDAKIYKVLTDPAGGSTTYGTAVDIVGATNMQVTGTVNVKDLRGDNTFLDSDSTLNTVDVALDYAKLNLDAIAILLGGTITDTGTTPAQLTSWSLLQNPVFGSFKLEGKCSSSDFVGGDIHVVLWKCRLVDFPQLGFKGEDYQQETLKLKAMPRLSDGKWLDVNFNETAVAIV